MDKIAEMTKNENLVKYGILKSQIWWNSEWTKPEQESLKTVLKSDSVALSMTLYCSWQNDQMGSESPESWNGRQDHPLWEPCRLCACVSLMSLSKRFNELKSWDTEHYVGCFASVKWWWRCLGCHYSPTCFSQPLWSRLILVHFYFSRPSPSEVAALTLQQSWPRNGEVVPSLCPKGISSVQAEVTQEGDCPLAKAEAASKARKRADASSGRSRWEQVSRNMTGTGKRHFMKTSVDHASLPVCTLWL